MLVINQKKEAAFLRQPPSNLNLPLINVYPLYFNILTTLNPDKIKSRLAIGKVHRNIGYSPCRLSIQTVHHPTGNIQNLDL